MSWKHHAAPRRSLPPLRGGFPDGAVRATLVDRPTVTVRQLDLAGGERVVVKRYVFPRWGQRLRALHRHAWLGLPKPVSEARNLLRLRAAGAPALEPLAWAVETGPLGIVRDGWLMLPWLEGSRTLEQVLLAGERPGAAFWRRLGAEVGRVHDAGCWYRNLAARNVLLAGDVADPELHWIDPSKSQWFPPPLDPGRAAADLVVFLVPLEALLPAGAWAEFAGGYGRHGERAGPAALWDLMPRDLRRRVEQWVRRERERLAEAATV